jgi:hypothetical protein
MDNQGSFKYSKSFNLILWCSIALFLVGIIETIGIAEFIPEQFKTQFTGPVLIVLGAVLFLIPLREIKQALKESDDK